MFLDSECVSPVDPRDSFWTSFYRWGEIGDLFAFVKEERLLYLFD